MLWASIATGVDALQNAIHSDVCKTANLPNNTQMHLQPLCPTAAGKDECFSFSDTTSKELYLGPPVLHRYYQQIKKRCQIF